MQDFCEQLKQHGYAFINISEEDAGTLQKMYAAVRQFFLLPSEIKECGCPYQEANEVGYKHVQQFGKEFFAIKLDSNRENIYKDSSEHLPDDLESMAVSAFRVLERMALECLRLISAGLQVEYSKLECLLDSSPSAVLDHTASFMHAFKYTPAASDSTIPFLQCPAHTDSGLVTIIPCAEVSGLEVLDWRNLQWQKVEEQSTARSPDKAVVLLGETMARLTCLYFQASVHRVVRQPEEVRARYSLPFQLRAHPQALIDSVGLASPVIPLVPSLFQPSVAVQEFIK